ncbi:hypothetical protein N9N67_02110 [Bacteriovoracaceae bacterium]|nr:hypothetical protein [Bacteriovoracaceae bacterium]
MKKITLVFILQLFISNFFIGCTKSTHHTGEHSDGGRLMLQSTESLINQKKIDRKEISRVKQSQKAKASRLAELLHVLFPATYASLEKSSNESSDSLKLST